MRRPLIAVMSLSSFLAGCGAAEQAADSQPADRQAPPSPQVAAGPTRTTGGNGLAGLDMTSGNASGSAALPPANPVPSNAAAQPGARNATPAPVAQPAGPTVPAGANFTIFCTEYSSPDHIAEATEMKRVLAANTQLKDFYLIHEEGRSVLYHGYYKQIASNLPANATPADKADAERAKRDKELLEKIPNPRALDRKLFGTSIFVPLNAPDPTAPPEWNLANAKGFWSVQIAAYTTPDRKQLAVESVRAARDAGIEAYYYHGNDGISQVCVGSWPEGAMKLPAYEANPGRQGVDFGTDPDKPLIYSLDDRQLSEESLRKIGRGTGVRVLQPKAEIVDESMLKTLREYPVHAVNGEEQVIADTGEPRPSFVVYIPGKQSTGLSTNGLDDANVSPQDAERLRNRSQTERLRGIGR